MDRKSRLGDQQAEGNLGNERNRNSSDRSSSESGSARENLRNRSSEGSMRERSRNSEDMGSGEDWSPSGETDDNNDSRRGGSER